MPELGPPGGPAAAVIVQEEGGHAAPDALHKALRHVHCPGDGGRIHLHCLAGLQLSKQERGSS